MSGAGTLDVAAPAKGADPFQDVVLTVGEDRIAILRIAPPPAPGSRSPVVTLTPQRMESLRAALLQVRATSGVLGLVVTGPTEEMFAAGADVKLIAAVATAEEAERHARQGQEIFNLLEDLPFPTVAALGGPVLGGGLELALAANARVAVDLPATRLGLPEVKLGILPGFGGTFRLPRLVGLPGALDLILTGRMLDPRRARKLGLVDRVVPPATLLAKARDEVMRRQEPRRRRLPLRTRLLSGPLRSLVVRAALKRATAGGARHYPAPRRALEVTTKGLLLSREHALQAEAQALGQLLAGPESRQLVQLFFRTEKTKKLHESFGGGAEVRRAVVVGAGVMGAGIAGLFARKGIATRVVDVALEPLRKATAAFARDLGKRQGRRQLTRAEVECALARWTPSTELAGLGACDLVLEAAVESLEVKRALFARAAGKLAPGAVVATNTSSLPIDQIAEGLPDPSRVVGIHFFNPPDKMPLIEIVRGPRTAASALAMAARLCSELGKFGVVVKDSPGFLVNRCLAPYLAEASRLLLEGCEPEVLDAALVEFGFPMGPAALLDEIGYDVAAKVAVVLEAAFGERMACGPIAEAMTAQKLLGKKSGGGLYRDGKAFGPGRDVLRRLRREHGRPAPVPAAPEIVDRCVLPLLSEAVRCLDEEIVENDADLDLAMVMGIGFPPFRGGPMAYAQSAGVKALVDRMDELARRLGPRLLPYDGLRRRAVR